MNGRDQEQAVGGSEGESRTAVSAVAVAESAKGEESKEEESKAESKRKSWSSRRNQRAANRSLYVSPGLRFITRKDLYTFLTSAGVSASILTVINICFNFCVLFW